MKKTCGTVINQDADGFLYSVGAHLEATTPESLRAFPHQFEGSGITDYIMCVCNSTASYPSKVVTSVLDKYYQKEENGKPVDYTDHVVMKAAHHIYETLNTDYIKIWHEEFRKMGITPWISFRMNDAHGQMQETSFLCTDQYHEHPECYRVTHHKRLEYYDHLWDFGTEYAQDLYCRFLEEALERYDTDGVEFDFLRESWCLPIGGEYEGIDKMTAFMRALKARIVAAEQRWGHPIRVAFRGPSTPQMCMDFGFDVMTYAKEGLIDVVIPGARWKTNDTDMPTRLWCSMMNPYGVDVWVGIENNLAPCEAVGLLRPTLDHVAAIGAAALYQGASKTYLYNFFRGIVPMLKPAAEQDGSDAYWNRVTLAADYDKMMARTRRSMLSFRDYQPRGYPAAGRLPIYLTKSDDWPFSMRFQVGEVPADARVYFRFSVSDPNLNPEDLYVWLSGEECTPVAFEPLEQDENYTENPILTFLCTKPIRNGIAVGEVQMKHAQTLTVDFAEVVIVPASN